VDAELNEAELIDYLRRHLPRHMIPAAIMTLPRLPLTPNRKVDVAALPAPEAPGGRNGPDGGDRPGDRTERDLVTLWEQLLGRDQVGVHDSFFRLGGHSLHLMRMVAQIREGHRVNVPLAFLFEQPTIAAVAAYVREHRDGH
jgi:aryl carrier-like protein